MNSKVPKFCLKSNHLVNFIYIYTSFINQRAHIDMNNTNLFIFCRNKKTCEANNQIYKNKCLFSLILELIMRMDAFMLILEQFRILLPPFYF